MLKGGRSLERRSRCAPAPGRRTRSSGLARGRRDRRRARACARLRECRPDVAFIAAARPRRRGRHRAGAAGGDRHPLHGLGARALRALHRQGAREAPAARGGHSDARLLLVRASARSGSWASRRRCRASSASSAFRWSSSPPPGLGARRQVRAPSEELPSAIVGGPLLRPQGPARALRRGARPRRVGARSARTAPTAASRSALPVVEAVPREQDFYDFEARYEIGMTTFVCPAELPPSRRARAGARARVTGCSAATASRAST